MKEMIKALVEFLGISTEKIVYKDRIVEKVVEKIIKTDRTVLPAPVNGTITVQGDLYIKGDLFVEGSIFSEKDVIISAYIKD